MKILIIEDEHPAALHLHRLLEKHFPNAGFVPNLDTVSRSIRWLKENPHPDLIFCDIQLGDGVCFEIFEQVKIDAPVIFTTAYDQYAIRAFQVNAIDYLLKPIDPSDLSRAVEKFKTRKLKSSFDLDLLHRLLHPAKPEFKTRFLVRFGEKIQSVPVGEVAFFFSEERITFLQTFSGKKYVLDFTLEQIAHMVSPQRFYRLNRKYIAAVDAIDEVLSYSNSRLKIKLKLCTDSDILISREKVSDFKDWLDQ